MVDSNEMTAEFGNDSELKIVLHFDPKDYPFGKLDFTIAGYGLVRASECNLSFLCVDFEAVPLYGEKQQRSALISMKDAEISANWKRRISLTYEEVLADTSLLLFEDLIFSTRIHLKARAFDPFLIMAYRDQDVWNWKVLNKEMPDSILNFQFSYRSACEIFMQSAKFLRNSILK